MDMKVVLAKAKTKAKELTAGGAVLAFNVTPITEIVDGIATLGTSFQTLIVNYVPVILTLAVAAFVAGFLATILRKLK